MKPFLALLAGCLALASAYAETFRDPRAAEFYKQHPEFFRFAQPADLPKDLDWKDGSDQQEFADPRALRGGTLHQMIITTPPTLRRVGANANNGFRADLYENNDLGLLASPPTPTNPSRASPCAGRCRRMASPPTSSSTRTRASPTASRSRPTTSSIRSTSSARLGPMRTGTRTSTRRSSPASPATTTIPSPSTPRASARASSNGWGTCAPRRANSSRTSAPITSSATTTGSSPRRARTTSPPTASAATTPSRCSACRAGGPTNVASTATASTPTPSSTW